MPHAPDLSGCALDDRYELHAVIGEGAFGRVYRGLDRRLARPVAVKVIKPWWTEDPEWAASFQREAQLLARVSDPGIVQIFDVGHAPEGLYYVSELVEGESLAGRLHRGPLGPWEACEIAVQLCRALAHAHDRGIIHRDVKPANILLSAQGRVKVGDFGVARLAEGSTDGAATIVGTPRYMAPEQGEGLPTTPATDVYSVGVVLYEMLTGAPPFSGDTAVELALRHLKDQPAPLPERLPPALVQITGRALAKDPARRYADGAEMAGALLDARRQLPRQQRPSGEPRARVTPPRARAAASSSRRHAATPPRGDAPMAATGAIGDATATATATATAVLDDAPIAPGSATAPASPLPASPLPASPLPASSLPASPLPPSPFPASPLRASTLPPSRRGQDDTRAAPLMSPRRDVNPPARRRAAAALAVVVVLLVAMIAAAAILRPAQRTTVPSFAGASRATASALARRGHVRVVFSPRHSAARAGTVIAQRPDAGAHVSDGAIVRVTLSAGLAPVEVPLVVGQNEGEAGTELSKLGLAPVMRQVAAPGIAPGTVTRQLPAAGGSAAPHSTVVLSVAEIPQWRPLSSFTGGRSVPFRILGDRWRVLYRMSYQGMCTFIFFCSGPNARVADLGNGSTVAAFGLNDGSNETRTFDSGPGLYQISVTPGGDDADWSVEVEDYY